MTPPVFMKDNFVTQRIRQVFRINEKEPTYGPEYRVSITKKRTGHMAKIFITGIAGGFGLPTAKALSAQGHQVAGSVRNRSGRNADAVATLEGFGAQIVEMDVTDNASAEAGVADAISALNGLDVLFNNAGIGSYGIQELMSPEDMARVFDVNVTGVQRVMRAALPHFRAQGRGTVLYTSSLIGRIATPFYGTYCASKWALEAIVECYRTELSGFGIEILHHRAGCDAHGLFRRHGHARRSRARG